MSKSLSGNTESLSQFEGKSLSQILRWRLSKDRMATRVVVVSGLSIIFVILAIFFVIAAEVFPLFKAPRLTPLADMDLQISSPPLAFGVDEYQEVAYIITKSGIKFFSVKNNQSFDPISLSDLGDAHIVAASPPLNNSIVLSLSDGRVLPIQIKFGVSYANDRREVIGSVKPNSSFQFNSERKPVTLLSHIKNEDGFWIAGVTGNHNLSVIEITQKKTLMGTVRQKESRSEFLIPNKGQITALVLGQNPDRVYVGTESGQIIAVNLNPREGVDEIETLGAVSDRDSGVSGLGFLKGGMTLVAMDNLGGVSSFHFQRGDDNRHRMERVHQFESHSVLPTIFAASQRNKGFITADSTGIIKYHYGTSGETQYEIEVGNSESLQTALLAPKDNGLLAVDEKGQLKRWVVENHHPDITWNTLFNEVKYEGYPESDYVWQSTGGTDDFESKISLIPLIFGTLKGTFYAMLVAIPIALFGAFYASQFMNPSLMGVVKPTVEFMAAIPSVVLGFFGALWLSPRVETLLPSIIIFPFVTAGLVYLYQWAGDKFTWRSSSEKNSLKDFWILIFIVLIGSLIAYMAGPIFESSFFDGNYKTWLRETMGLGFDQRNSLIVGLAMGFAVIPIIFTIAEDSLSNVPRHLTAASLAVGATPWQTAIQVVLPAAIPGIFSAVMIGFGRAVGETMIVLMATGNTPILDWNIFNGFRAMSANIAVELPEAPEGETLFRVLFLTALILYFTTFIFNSLAEWVRLRLRKKYQLL